MSAALQPNLANVSMAFALCSALYIRMVLEWSRFLGRRNVSFPQSLVRLNKANLVNGKALLGPADNT